MKPPCRSCRSPPTSRRTRGFPRVLSSSRYARTIDSVLSRFCLDYRPCVRIACQWQPHSTGNLRAIDVLCSAPVCPRALNRILSEGPMHAMVVVICLLDILASNPRHAHLPLHMWIEVSAQRADERLSKRILPRGTGIRVANSYP